MKYRVSHQYVDNFGLNFAILKTTYRKVASSIPVYYSFFDHFWGATN